MHRTHLHAACLLALLIPCATLAQLQPRPSEPALGMNLAGPADYMTELPLVDAFKTSRPWISQREGADWGQGPALELDEHGWVTELEEGCFAETLMLTIEGGHYPGGAYTVLYDGSGTIEFWGSGTVVEAEPGRIVLDVDPSRGALFLRLLGTDPGDYVRNIRVIMPGFEDTYEEDPFHPVFLDRWRGVACIRFMDWMHTNNSSVAEWEDRPTLQSATYSAKGMALELMVDYCNRIDADAWFCMPHLCTDDYVRQFATYVRDRLDPDLRVYIEYSNEVWNGMFAQASHAEAMGVELGIGPAERPWEGAGMYYSMRSLEIFATWEEVWGGTNRLVRVLAWQAANPWWSENIVLPAFDAYQEADALAIAPYISFNIPAQGDDLTADQVAGWSLERLFERLESHALPESLAWIEDQKAIAEQFGLELIAYEAGQHLVGVGGGENNDRMTALFHAANADPRMGALYDAYLRGWTESGGGLLANFSSVSEWSKWGSWGVLQYYDDDPSDSPKLMALTEWARSLGQPVSAE
ncbi:MAG: hypothetical protein GF320_13340 [Armatimonadia bacterium]|nr:hypothetical protein [Armatimonadia bacterium]